MSAEEKTTAPAIPLEIITLPMVEDDIKNLLWDHPLFGEVLNNCTRSVSRDIPTACVTAKLQLIVNPDFYAAQGKEERRGVLSHEIFHLIMEHIPRFMSVYDTKDRNLCQIANIAMDCAINQLLPYKLPTDCITVESVRNLIKDKSIKVEEKQSAEYYYKLLKTAYDETAESMKDAIKALEEALKNGIPDHSKHFEDGKEGKDDTPVMASQWLPYMQMQMADYLSGKRKMPSIPLMTSASHPPMVRRSMMISGFDCSMRTYERSWSIW